MSLMLPSRASHEKAARVRAIRRVLGAHVADVLNGRVERCACGWYVPSHLLDGANAHRDHVADRIGEAL